MTIGNFGRIQKFEGGRSNLTLISLAIGTLEKCGLFSASCSGSSGAHYGNVSLRLVLRRYNEVDGALVLEKIESFWKHLSIDERFMQFFLHLLSFFIQKKVDCDIMSQYSYNNFTRSLGRLMRDSGQF